MFEFNTPDIEKACKVKEYAEKKGIELVHEVFDYAAEKNVRTVYEDQGYIFNGVNGFGEFLDKVDRSVGVVADSGNIYQSGDSIEEFINDFHEKIVHAHIKDVIVSDAENSGYPSLDGRFVNYNVEIGKGDVDFKKIIELLKSYGYDGCYGIEYATTDDNSPVIERILRRVDEWMR